MLSKRSAALSSRGSVTGQRHYLALVAEDPKNRITQPRGRRKESFPRDSSASLGMTAGIFHGKKRTQNDRSAGDRWSPLQKTITKAYFFHSHPLFSVMLSVVETSCGSEQKNVFQIMCHLERSRKVSRKRYMATALLSPRGGKLK